MSFTFDDFPRSALLEGGSILEKFEARGTFYVAGSLMGQNNNLGEQFTRNDLFELVRRGHEIASHTFAHSSARKVPYESFRRDAERGEQLVRDLVDASSGNFAYPYGDVTLTAKRNLGPQMLSSRGTTGGINGPLLDLNLLRANSLYGGMEVAPAARRWIDGNNQVSGWLIFYTHDVSQRPSPYGCTPELFEEVCSYAVARKARILTIAQVMQELGQVTTVVRSSEQPLSAT